MDSQPIKFTMNYYALKTFGRQQYSNAWAALSELVANGFDARAQNVYLYINMINKQKSIIEIIDDGCGMNVEDLKSKYAVIGRNRRIENPNDNAAGRKGIGKLAALYLSDEFQIISKKDKLITAWGVNVKERIDTETPSLDPVDISNVNPVCDDVWNIISKTQGTMIRLLNVDLTRIGDRAVEALKQRLSNYFLFDSLNSVLRICIIRKENDIVSFEPIQKQIAFDNMSCIYYSDSKFLDIRKNNFNVEYSDKMNGKKTLTIERTVEGLPSDIATVEIGNKIKITGIGTFYGVSKLYALTGWIGVHSSIEKKIALNNDNRFIRNNYYNPNQIRVYVRNKLANENILNRLGLVGTYANYIEGEISFDILDDNDFEDIATSNRQDFSIEDERVKLLLEILKGLCRQLLQRRQELADKINEEKKKGDMEIQSKQKTHFTQETHKDLISAGVSSYKASELSVVIGNKLKGEYDIKTTYKLFISHASKDRIFTDFISHYLKYLGFRWDEDISVTEIFYSSDGTDITNATPLADVIKNMILDSNTDVLFMTSKNFMDSQYCLFEGGAAWATRAILEYCIIALDYGSIPDFLTNKKAEFSFNTNDKNSFILNKQNYTNIVVILNRIISHLNKNRTREEKKEVSLIQKPKFDDLVQMKALNKNINDYMDENICKYWQMYVIDKLDDYLKLYK